MSTGKRIASCALILSASLLFGQNLPRTLPARQSGMFLPAPKPGSSTEHRGFQLHGKKFVSWLRQPETESPLEWTPSQTLPLNLATAEQVAREELRKWERDEPSWSVTDFQISRFNNGSEWYCAVTLKPAAQLTGVAPDSFTLLLDLAGKPGRVVQLASP